MPIIPKWLGAVFRRQGIAPATVADFAAVEPDPFFEVVEIPQEMLESSPLEELERMGPFTEAERVAVDRIRTRDLKARQAADDARSETLGVARDRPTVAASVNTAPETTPDRTTDLREMSASFRRLSALLEEREARRETERDTVRDRGMSR